MSNENWPEALRNIQKETSEIAPSATTVPGRREWPVLPTPNTGFIFGFVSLKFW